MLHKIGENKWTLQDHPTTLIDWKLIEDDDYFRYVINEDYQHFFPQYDVCKHHVKIFNDVGRTNMRCYIQLYENNKHVSFDFNPGYYVLMTRNYSQHILEKRILRQDEFLDVIPEPDMIKTDINTFFNNSQTYKDVGSLHKRAALLFGSHGTGKTTALTRICSEHIDGGGVVIFVSTSFDDMSTLYDLRKALGPRKVILIFEELTNRIEPGQDVATVLSFFDGQYSIDNTYSIATTNYPERLPANLIDRPGRFDLVLEFKNPTAKARRKFLENYLENVSDDDIKLTENFSLAYLKEVVIQCRLTGRTVREIFNNLKEQRSKLSGSFKKGVGLA